MPTKIAKGAASALYTGRPYRNGNTEVRWTREGDVGTLYLHGTAIARVADDLTAITVGDWNTPTTRERLNALPGVDVCVSRGVLYLNGHAWSGDWTYIHDANTGNEPNWSRVPREDIAAFNG